MAKGPPPDWSKRDCRFDHVVASVLAKGFKEPLYYRGIETPERAHDIKQGFFRCGRHREISVSVEWLHSGEWVTKSAMWPPDKDADGTYTLRLTAYRKGQGRKWHIQKYGTDRANWPYNPRAPKSDNDIEAWKARGLNEKGHQVR